MSNSVGLNVGLSDSLAAKTRLYADYYRHLAAGTITDVYDDETVTLGSCFYRAFNLARATFLVAESMAGYGLFMTCTNLTHVDFPKLKNISVNAFNGDTKLSYVFFPKVTLISNTAFLGSGLERADFQSCANIGTACFHGCSKLKEIKIPVCTNISRNAFYNCTALEKIFLDGVTAVPTLGSGALDGTPEELKIIVPDNLVDAFKVATNWSAYADKIVGISEYNAAT